MTTLKTIVAALLLAGGTSLGMAQNGQTPSATGGATGSPAATAMNGSDTVILSAAQRRAVWKDLSKKATNQNVAGFNAAIGTFVPKAVKTKPMPSNVTANNPSLQPYDFAMVDHKLVIVDPSNKVIADVLKK